ncbi:MAG: exodeoxyribonuclease VII large subunit, partial [Lachnospiraceae bacterium]|nr:exodeoxyribonuclease VII large subunit [Lachnospiraceae bacterium]
APTPSAAAELAVFDYERFVQDLNDKQYILARSLKRQVLNSRNMVEQYRLRLINKSPQNKLMQNRQYINDIQSRMSDMVHERINSKRNRLSVISERLNGLSPLNKLSKGFAYVQDNKGMPLVDIGQIKTGDRIKLHLKNGSALADITNINKL